MWQSFNFRGSLPEAVIWAFELIMVSHIPKMQENKRVQAQFGVAFYYREHGYACGFNAWGI